jgi:hypothetical protein
MSHLHAVLPEEDQAQPLLISIESNAPVDHRSISLTRKTTIGQTGSNQMTSSILSGAADCAQIATQLDIGVAYLTMLVMVTGRQVRRSA